MQKNTTGSKLKALREYADYSPEKLARFLDCTPEQVAAWAKSAEERGLKVIIGAAGKAAALAGVVAAHTPLPVVAVPMKTSDLGGMDSLLSTVQMPTGVPLACVAINGTKNAAILATQILSVGMPAYREVIRAYKQELAEA